MGPSLMEKPTKSSNDLVYLPRCAHPPAGIHPHWADCFPPLRRSSNTASPNLSDVKEGEHDREIYLDLEYALATLPEPSERLVIVR
jgi:hypothetical protein